LSDADFYVIEYLQISIRCKGMDYKIWEIPAF